MYIDENTNMVLSNNKCAFVERNILLYRTYMNKESFLLNSRHYVHVLLSLIQ